jgi:hypothetical protein
VNHLAPFLLTTLLLDRPIESKATVLNTSRPPPRLTCSRPTISRHRPTPTMVPSKIKKEPSPEPMLADFGLRPATLGEETAGQSPSGDSQQHPRLP